MWLSKFSGSDVSIVSSTATILGFSGKSLQGIGIHIDASSNVWVSGNTDSAIDGQALTGTQDTFLVKYNSAVSRQTGSTRLIGCSGGETTLSGCRGLGMNSNGEVYIVGSTTCNLDGQTKTGTQDQYLTYFSNTLVKQCTSLVGTSGQLASAEAVAVDGSTVWFAGYVGDDDGTSVSGTFGGKSLSGFQSATLVRFTGCPTEAPTPVPTSAQSATPSTRWKTSSSSARLGRAFPASTSSNGKKA